MVTVDKAVKFLSELLLEEITPNCSEAEFMKVYKPFFKSWSGRVNMNGKKYYENDAKTNEFEELCRKLLSKTEQFQHMHQ